MSVLTLAAAACAAPTQATDDAANQTPNATTPPITDAEEEDVRFLARLLLNPVHDAPTRRGAAERLLRLGVTPAYDVLDAALRSDDNEATRAVIEAMSASPDPPSSLLEPAVQLLRTAPQEMLDALALALTKYDDEALNFVAALARDRNAPIAERVGPIYALGAFATQASGDQLMALADPLRGEDEAIKSAAYDSLRRLVQLDLDDDYAAWRNLWNEARDKSPEQWARELARVYQKRNADLGRQQDALAQRYVTLLQEHYRALAVPEQLERLPRDLEDELAAVRLFALDRIDRLVRDSEPIPEGLRVLIVERLDDQASPVRLRAAQLLDGLGEPSLPELIVQRLPTERDRHVIASYLELLADRPTPSALKTLLDLLPDEQLGQASADALWELLTRAELSAELQSTTREAVRQSASRRTTPGLIRIIAYIGDDADVQAVLAERLDDDDPAMRSAAAEGLLARGVYDPVFKRVADPAIYPHALAAVAKGPADLGTFRHLVQLKPPPAATKAWADAVEAFSDRLDPTLLLEADQILVQLPYADGRVRSTVLERGLRSGDGLPIEHRIGILIELAPLLVEQGEALEAFELLEALGAPAATPPLSEVKFRAALMAGRYDAAAAVHDDAEPWVVIFGELVDAGSESAPPLRDEIEARFADTLTGTLQQAFDEASADLPAAGPPPEAGAGRIP